MLIDSHCHIQDREFDADREEVLARAKEAGVDHVLAVGSTLSSSRRARDLAQKQEQVFAAVGIHPHNSAHVTGDTFAAIRELAAAERVVALGAMGLDYYRDLSPEYSAAGFRYQINPGQGTGAPTNSRSGGPRGYVEILRRKAGEVGSAPLLSVA